MLRLLTWLLGKETLLEIIDTVYHGITGVWIQDLEQHAKQLDRYIDKYGYM